MEIFRMPVGVLIRRIFCFIIVLFNITLTQSCTNLPTKLNFKPHSEALVEPRYFSVDIPSFDGKKLRATIYQPALAPGDTAPVVVHTHAFAFFRMARPTSLYGKFLYTGKAALEVWKQGYWVVSIDQRGHGGSEGIIRVMHPEYEVKDITYVLNWIEDNLPRIKYKDGDPLIGMIGESYGGGAQLMSSGLDSRIDAIVPVTTWYDIQESLAPNDVPKSGWLTTLILLGNMLNFGNVDPKFNEAYFKARDGSLEKDFFASYMGTHSTSHSCNCDAGYAPQADALIIQGFRDVLFPINQAAKNFDCLKESGVDVRLMGTQDGHLLAFTQFSRGVPGFHMENYVHCGPRKLNTVQMVVDWFDEKLMGKVGAADDIPTVCLTHDYKSGSVFSSIPVGGESFTIPKTRLKTGLAGFFEMPMGIWDRMTSWIPSWKGGDSNITGGMFRPAFVPLKTIQEDGMLAGLPIAELRVDSPKKDVVVFVGVGVKKANRRKVELISEQINPVYGNGLHEIELAGVSSRLEPGDVVGMLVSSYSNQYRFSGSGLFTRAEVTGSLSIPIQSRSNDEYIVQSYVKP